MSELSPVNGHCLCGKVCLTATPKSQHLGACHCDMCRRWGGGPLLVVDCENVEVSGDDSVGIYASSDWAERGFCKQCGTHLFYRLKEGGLYAVPVGVLDGDSHWQLAEQVFIDSKPGYYSFAEKTRNLTGEELFAQFGAE
ncbi:GFA family protein [Alcanivorax sp. DP30]|uniref:GFA family protein n=1 Tax=Alcanivorax sp. DP30 TaxID=2606217 RepID=UPI00136ED3BB|nr:GFA family protein [Alcanivorax sp. DP30]MZR61998.1 GFA family protein [Alcanivorax sp. DP30]